MYLDINILNERIGKTRICLLLFLTFLLQNGMRSNLCLPNTYILSFFFVLFFNKNKSFGKVAKKNMIT